MQQFDPSLLKAAHAACQSKARDSCAEGLSPVVVDNTNVRRWEMNFYFNLANRRGYRLVLVESR